MQACPYCRTGKTDMGNMVGPFSARKMVKIFAYLIYRRKFARFPARWRHLFSSNTHTRARRVMACCVRTFLFHTCVPRLVGYLKTFQVPTSNLSKCSPYVCVGMYVTIESFPFWVISFATACQFFDCDLKGYNNVVCVLFFKGKLVYF